jgi:hypothetical protein
MANASAPDAALVHAIPGRARLRLVPCPSSDAELEQLTHALATIPGVEEVRCATRTGSLLLLHGGELQPILDQAEARGLLTPRQVPLHAPMTRVKRAIETLDERIADETHHATSLGGLGVVFMVGAAIYQVSTGKALAAGTTLLKDALAIMDWVSRREPKMSPRRGAAVSEP